MYEYCEISVNVCFGAVKDEWTVLLLQWYSICLIICFKDKTGVIAYIKSLIGKVKLT